jgi:CheY-like chemotaxis protein
VQAHGSERREREEREERRKVLVVEDDAALRDALLCALGTQSLDVVGARDGDEALDHLVFQPPPLAVVLDLRLPGELNGWDLLQWMRRDPELKSVPVVVVSGAIFERVELTLPNQPVAILQKPVDPGELIAVLRDVVSARDRPW